MSPWAWWAVAACLLCSASYRKSGTRSVSLSRGLILLDAAWAFWSRRWLCFPGTTNVSVFSSKAWDQPHNLQISSAVWKSASSYFQSSDSSECSFHLATPPIFTHPSANWKNCCLCRKRTSRLFSVKFISGMCASYFFFILLYLHRISVWYIASSLFFKGGSWISGPFRESPFVV